MIKQVVKQGYNQIAEIYHQNREEIDHIKYLTEFTKFIMPGSTILDLGCGSGKPIDRFLADKGYSIIGVDISERLIQLAQSFVPSGRYHVADMMDLQPGAFSVEGVISYHSIFHLPRAHHAEMINKIFSFLKPGGYMLITMGAVAYEGSRKYHGADMYWSQHGSEENTKIVKSAGFEIIKDEIETSSGQSFQVIIAKKPGRG